jgi:hypothetical protein
MATLTFSLTIGANNTTATISPTNARTLQFIDDLIAGPYAGITPPLTQTQAGQKWLDDLMAGQVAWAKGLRQDELNKAVGVADDLTGA